MDWLFDELFSVQFHVQLWQAVLTAVGVGAAVQQTAEWTVWVCRWVSRTLATRKSNRLLLAAKKDREAHDIKVRNEGIDRLLREFPQVAKEQSEPMTRYEKQEKCVR